MLAQYAIPLTLLMVAPFLLRVALAALFPWRRLLRLYLATGGIAAFAHWIGPYLT
ncbi:hypothetical protein [Rubellimicrobium arenae]|uniref:hypothetical protein n=1 Tax=Rubellimicrobium arenae TaxID=2817372 RepID=UPI001B30254A|nr:hypothetical protein [Rubellimicrobium arenae]